MITDWYYFSTEYGEYCYYNPKTYCKLRADYIDYFKGFGKEIKFNVCEFHLKLMYDRLKSLKK